MWTYEQSSGALTHNGVLVGMGYAGAGDGKNNPDAQDQHNVGPIPRGVYVIGSPHDTLTHGPFVMPLTPVSSNQMFGRSGSEP